MISKNKKKFKKSYDSKTFAQSELNEIHYYLRCNFLVWVFHCKENATVENQHQNEIVKPFVVYYCLKQFTKAKK